MAWYSSRSWVVGNKFVNNVNYGEFQLFVVKSISELIDDSTVDITVDNGLDFVIKSGDHKITVVKQIESIDVIIFRGETQVTNIQSDDYANNIEFHLDVCKAIISHIKPQSIKLLMQ